MRSPHLLILALLSAALASASGPAPAYTTNPDFQKARAEAIALAKQPQNVSFAAKSWRKANTIAGGHCMECYHGMIKAASDSGELKDAVKYAIEMEAASDNPVDKSTAEFYQGRFLARQAGLDKPKPALLEAAHAAYTKALSNDPDNNGCNFLDGVALAQLGRNEEASAAFRQYANHTKSFDPLLTRAKHFAENPELARHKMAPPIVVKTLAGKSFNLDDMGGRVVLVDFWATWCGPCNAELPHMKKLAAKYANDPFEIVSISWDSDETKWKNFIAEHGMEWNQYLDKEHKLSSVFGVEAIPHYFTIDSDGVLTAENIGSGSMADGRIDKLVKRAREAQHAEKLAAALPSTSFTEQALR